MRYRFEECLERGKIVKIPVDPALVEKEREEAAADLVAAEHSLGQNQVKWAIIQGYYSLFHSLRSRIFAKGYREKSHRCLRHAVEALLVDEGELGPDVLDHFSFAMDLREGADYGCIYNAESAGIVVESARIVYDRISTE
ncbi:MAG: HEPN domain-containing protein [Methanoregula sp.]|uniref:HEPN domain-containing protein n=1 Tax=Methanoregula sp. TaxID=2052170 RepID=UPI0025EE6A5A|nr:HEPN domain-containing protein [Methanoregula sp.]MCK9632422.1 HEPN domain-containing protein [Methanoregula sp.]